MTFQNDLRNGAIRNTNLNQFAMPLAKCELHKTERGGGNSLCLHFHCIVFNTSQQKFYFWSVQLKSSFLLSFLVIFEVTEIVFFLQLMPCYVFLDSPNCSFLIISRKFIPKFSADCVYRSLWSNNVRTKSICKVWTSVIWELTYLIP